MNTLLRCLPFALLAAACMTDERRPDPLEPDAVARLEPKSGSTVAGVAEFFTRGAEVRVEIELEATPAGTHAVHLHEKGDCSSDDAESAGPHWNPTEAEHGHLAHPPAHLGDIGNVEVGADGRGRLVFSTSHWTLGTNAENDIVGKALVVHEKVDDFVSQPAGNAGKRIACGVVRESGRLPLVSFR